MSLLEKPSIYNAPSVYNQGGGGGGGSFTVDIGGGVSQELTFPPYLVPVEYIDNSNLAHNNFCLYASEQIPIVGNASNLYIKFVLKANANALTENAETKPYNFTPGFISGSNDEIRANIRKYNGNGIVTIICGNKNQTFSDVDYTKKLTLITDTAHNLFTLKQNESSQTLTDNRTPPTKNFGRVSIFNYDLVGPSIFRGSFFYGYIKNSSTNELYSLLVPARAKNDNDTKPYIVECVSGSVAINCSQNLSTSGIEFGPDIDLSSEIPDWIT